MARTPYWADNIVLENVPVSGGSDNVDLFPGLSRDERRGITVVRLLIDLQVSPLVLDGVNAQQLAMMGIGVSSFEAFAVAGALPDPNQETDRPPRGWLWRSVLKVAHVPDALVMPVRAQADVRAKRRVDDGVLFLRIINVDRTGVTPFEIAVDGLIRVLYLLP